MRVPESAQRYTQRLEPLTVGAIATMRARYPRLPNDYLDFLKAFGFGGLGSTPHSLDFTLYSAPIEPSLVFGAEAKALDARYLVFGDALGCGFAAFDLASGQVVEVWHEDLTLGVVAENFSVYLLGLLTRIGNAARSDDP